MIINILHKSNNTLKRRTWVLHCKIVYTPHVRCQAFGLCEYLIELTAHYHASEVKELWSYLGKDHVTTHAVLSLANILGGLLKECRWSDESSLQGNLSESTVTMLMDRDWERVMGVVL